MKEEVEPSIAFCEVLRQQRMSRGLTHKSLGIRSGLPARYLLELENGNKEPYLKTIHKLDEWVHFSSIGPDGGPHVTPLMMGIHEQGLLFSFTGKQKKRNLELLYLNSFATLIIDLE